MAKIIVSCPKCAAQYQIDSVFLGRVAHCNKCDTRFVLERPVEATTRTYAAAHDSSTAGASNLSEEELWRVGQIILDVYEVKPIAPGKPYAHGGMGIVYRVHHHGWGIDLAVKSPKKSVVATEQGKASFERECEAWIQLGLHPNIVTCYYVRRIDDIPRVFAEFVEGGTLWQWIRRGKLYQGGPEEALVRILDIAIQCAWGLAHAHAQGVIHQDVKPENVMMQGLVPKMTDFGLARILSPRRSESGTDQGDDTWGGMTPAYCSPEQVKAALQVDADIPPEQRVRLTHATDAWSWALVVLAMFCGTAPCKRGGHTARDVFAQYLDHGPPEARLPLMPPALAELLWECFEHDPEQRLADMNEIADRLRAVYREVTGSRYPRQQPVAAEWLADTLNNRAASMLDLGRQQEAEQFLEEAWQRHPWQPQVTFNRGLLAWRRGRVTDAEFIGHLQELCRTRPSAWVAHFALGLAQLERGEARHAISACESAADLGGGQEVEKTLKTARMLAGDMPRCTNIVTGRPAFVSRLYTSKNGTVVLLPIDEQQLMLFELPSAREIATFRLEYAGSNIAISNDGAWQLLRIDDTQWHLRRTNESNKLIVLRLVKWGERVAAYRDGQRFVANGQLIELRTADGQLVRTLRGHTATVRSLALTGDGAWLVSCANDCSVRLWELPVGRCLRTFTGHTDAPERVYVNADGAWAVSVTGGGNVRFWNLKPLTDVKRRFLAPVLLCHVTTSEQASRAQADFADFCFNARMALSAGKCDEALAQIRAARMLPGYKLARDALDLWHRAGRFAIRIGCNHVWCQRAVEAHADQILSVAVSQDCSWAVTGGADRLLKIWQLPAGICRQELAGHTDWVRAVAIGCRDSLIVSGGWDRTVRVWDASTGQCRAVLAGHTNCVNAVAVDPGQRLIASAGWDKSIRIWDINTGECRLTLTGHTAYVNAVAFSPDGHLLASCSDDTTVRIWDLTTGKCRHVLEGHSDWVHCCSFSSDGLQLISGGKDRSVRVWDVESGRLLKELAGSTGAVVSLSVCTDNRWLLSADKSRSLLLWSLLTGDQVLRLEGHVSSVTTVTFGRDGRWALSGDELGYLRLWEFDWEYYFPGWADWDEQARPFVEAFVRRLKAIGVQNLSAVAEENFDELLATLQSAGLGWIRPEGLKSRVRQMLGI